MATSSGSKAIVGKASHFANSNIASFGAFCKVLRPNEDVLNSYLKFYFKSKNYRDIISDLSSGANINNLRNEHFANLQIPLPTLPIQKKITEVLDKADELRQLKKKTIEKLDELIQSIFLDMFGGYQKIPISGTSGIM